MNFDLIKLEGKPLTKLIECVSNGIGTMYEPTRIKRKADADAYTIRTIAKAKAEAKTNNELIEEEIFNRIEKRLLYTERCRQENIDSVIAKAAELLTSVEQVSNENIDKDWSTAFFNYIQDISDEEMQDIWSRILAGEVERPNSHSLRTLNTLKLLSKEEALIFKKMSNFVLHDNSSYFVIENNNILPESKLSIAEKRLLNEIGLIEPTGSTIIERKLLPNTSCILFYNGTAFHIENKNTTNIKIRFGSSLLTKTGTDLIRLVNPHVDDAFLASFCNFLSDLGLSGKHSEFKPSSKPNEGCLKQPYIIF